MNEGLIDEQGRLILHDYLEAIGELPSAHAHCWHLAPTQHPMTNHRDDICCHCGKKRRVRTVPPTFGMHGQFSPGGPGRPDPAE